MNLTEATKYLAENGLVRDRSTVSKMLKKIGVCAKYGMVQKGALDKILEMNKRKTNKVRVVSQEDLKREMEKEFWEAIALIMSLSDKFGIKVTIQN